MTYNYGAQAKHGPKNFSDYNWYTDPSPGPLADGEVRGIAGRLAGSIIADARASDQPVVWITGNSYMPPLRSFTEAERVWNAANNEDGELFAFLVEELERHLNAADVLMESPDCDNALYAVDMRRWQYVEDHAGDDLNDEWEAQEDYHPATRFTRGPEPAAMTDR